MNAIVLSRYGSPATSLTLEEVAKPVPGDDEVLIKVRATTVNDVDWCFVRGRPYVYRLIFGLAGPKIAVLGAEVSGTIEATGKAVTTFEPGDDVYGDLSEAGFGGFAEYVCAPARALARKPKAMTFPNAAALPHAAMLALQGLVDVGRIQQGEKVLINGAGGGVGMIGLQIAKQYGAEVTGVDRSFKLDSLKSLGFDHVIDYQQEDFTRAGRRYDLILDTKTARSPFSYTRALNPNGRYVTVGGAPWRLIQLAVLGPLMSRLGDQQFRIVALKPNKNLAYFNEMFETRGIKCLIDGPYSLSDVPKVIQWFGEAQHIGKIVVSLDL